MTAIRPALGLSATQIEEVLRLAGAAPSPHNTQPWRYHVLPHVIELHADLRRRLPYSDPDDRELRVACGAALFNLRLALEHDGVRPLVTLMPHGDHPTALAAVRNGGRVNRESEHSDLFRSILLRRTNRRPFLDGAVPKSHRNALLRCVQPERSWLHTVEPSQRALLGRLAKRAHDMQMVDQGYRTELAHWSERPADAMDGIPATASDPRWEAPDEWVLRDFSGGRIKMTAKDTEDPLIVVLCSYFNTRAADMQAGQALQRMLLTATSAGLTASFLPHVVEVRQTRDGLRRMIGGSLEPQAVLRVGYGSLAPPTPRRAPDDLVATGEELAEQALRAM